MADLWFSVDSTELAWGANRKLGRVAGWAQANPTGIVVIEGHSDPRGSDAYNVELSLRRAHAARRELVEAGVPPERLVIAAFGERGPRHGTNRRVTIWATRNDVDVVLARLHTLGSVVVRAGTDDATSIVGSRR